MEDLNSIELSKNDLDVHSWKIIIQFDRDEKDGARKSVETIEDIDGALERRYRSG